MPFKPQNAVMVERIIAGLCYISGGLIGLLYIIISRSQSQSMFFRFHFLQSMVIVALAFLFNLTGSVLLNILGGVFTASNFAAGAVGLQYVAVGISWIEKLMMLVGLYGMVMAFLGKFAEIPLLSPLVRQNMRMR